MVDPVRSSTVTSPIEIAEITGAIGVTMFDDAEAALFPAAFEATTWQFTGLPFARPLTRSGEPVPDWDCEPQVALYPVMGDPPSVPGGVKDTTTEPSNASAVPIVGAPGTVRGVTTKPDEAGPAPVALVATTVQVTATPLASPATVIGEPAPETVWLPHVAA